LAIIRGIDINLLPGQLCWSQKSLAKRWKWNVKTVNKYLLQLTKREMVDTRKTNITTIITIKKWFLYQGYGSQSGYELAKMLIKKFSKESSLYSIIGLYKNSLGEDRLKDILADCIKRGNEFPTESQLAGYLKTCSETNGKYQHSFNPIEVKQ
jgi:DNA-binding transcriptional regulator YhcF (GntR family)